MKATEIKINYITEEEKYEDLKRKFAQRKSKKKHVDIKSGILAAIVSLMLFCNGLAEVGLLLGVMAVGCLVPGEIED